MSILSECLAFFTGFAILKTLMIGIIAIAEHDNVFTAVCSGLFRDDHKIIFVGLCIYLLLAVSAWKFSCPFTHICATSIWLPGASIASGNPGKGDKVPELRVPQGEDIQGLTNAPWFWAAP